MLCRRVAIQDNETKKTRTRVTICNGTIGEHNTACYEPTEPERSLLRSRKTVPRNLRERAVLSESEILRGNQADLLDSSYRLYTLTSSPQYNVFFGSLAWRPCQYFSGCDVSLMELR